MSDYRRQTVRNLRITADWKRNRVRSLEDELGRERRDLADLEWQISRLQGSSGLWWTLLLLRLERWLGRRAEKRKREGTAEEHKS